MGMALSLIEIARLLNCELPQQDCVVTGAAIDTRKVKVGNIFVALKGVNTDGHAFLAQARAAGASAALVSEKQSDELPQLVVGDVRKAFAQIARHWCQQSQAKVIAVTGSNGKTTVKEMITSILNQVGKVTSTQGNLNNDLGVPLTICNVSKNDDYAVIEMGANHPGEIAELVMIASPDVAIINNVAPAHLEGFGSIEGVAKAKGEIYQGLKRNGKAVINADMPYRDIWKSAIGEKETLSYALDSGADITADCIQLDQNSGHFIVKIDEVSHHFNLPLPGLHNVANALAAITVAKTLEIPVAAMVKGLANMKSVPHRLHLRKGMNDSKILDDTYNANPGSYTQALKALASFSGEHWLVLGDFGELGDDYLNIHRQMGEQARENGVAKLFTVGNHSQAAAESFGKNAEHFNDSDAVLKVLMGELNNNVVCLIKGSRFMQLDKLADKLTSEGES